MEKLVVPGTVTAKEMYGTGGGYFIILLILLDGQALLMVYGESLR